jgi:hypothetical protein
MFKTPLKKQIDLLNSSAKSYTYIYNGKKTKKEIYYGSGYLGQSGRYVVLPSGSKDFKIN